MRSPRRSLPLPQHSAIASKWSKHGKHQSTSKDVPDGGIQDSYEVAAEAMMLHNGVDPTQTEGMSKGVHRSEGSE